MNIQDLQLREERHRHRAIEHAINGNQHDALRELAEATRVRVYIDVLEGRRDIMKECIARHKSQPPGPIQTPISPQSSHRNYQLIDTGGLKANCDFLTRVAYQKIAQRQLEKPYRKPLAMPSFR